MAEEKEMEFAQEDVLQSAIQILGTRKNRYGCSEDSFDLIARYWSTYLGTDISAEDVAVLMALLKIARITTLHNKDSFVDAAAYVSLAYKLANESIWSKK